MANHQINITENGKTTLATAGKYCDRNIDVMVNVPYSEQPTQFTNILDLDTTIVKNGYRVTSTGYTETTDAVAIVCPCAAGTHRLRARGKYTFGYLQKNLQTTPAYYTNIYQATGIPTNSTFAGTIISSELKGGVINTDACGDFYVDFTTTADGYIGFNFKDMSLVYANGSFMEPIVTIDEPIGNGGIVG